MQGVFCERPRMVNLDYLLRSLPVCSGWFSLVLNKTWRCRRVVLGLRSSYDSVGLWLVKVVNQRLTGLQSSSHTLSTVHINTNTVLWVSNMSINLMQSSHTGARQCWKGPMMNNMQDEAISSADTKSETATVLNMREEKPTRKVDRCLYKVTRVQGKTLHSPSFIGSYSCNPAPQHDRTQYNSTEMSSSVRNLDRQLTSTLFDWTLGQINLHCTWTKDLISCSVLVNLYVSWPKNLET